MGRLLKFTFLFTLVACTSNLDKTGESVSSRIVTLNEELFEGLHKVHVTQTPDLIYKRDVDYDAYPLSEVLIKAFPNWKSHVANNAMLIMRSSEGQTPVMAFSEGFSGRAFLATNFVGRGADKPYDCWKEGSIEYCDLGYFMIWTDGLFPERPQPRSTTELEVVQFEEAFKSVIPDTESEQVHAGFSLYRKYCIECHRVNFLGGTLATEHVARTVPVGKKLLDYYLFQFRDSLPSTYMPDFNGILDNRDADGIAAYLDYMNKHQNICDITPLDSRCITEKM
jgi:cytochrome c2